MEHPKLSQSLEDYLEMVHMLRLANGIADGTDVETLFLDGGIGGNRHQKHH